MRVVLLTLILLALSPLPAAAFERLGDPDAFRDRVVGRELTRFGIRLTVHPDGRIEGNGFGWPVTGDWHWVEGYFCRTMDWSGYPIPYNCMVVLANNRSVRFIADRGMGDSADFRLR